MYVGCIKSNETLLRATVLSRQFIDMKGLQVTLYNSLVLTFDHTYSYYLSQPKAQ